MPSKRSLDKKRESARREAWAAVAEFNRLIPLLTTYARSMTGNPRIQIRLTKSTPRTDGRSIIWLRPPRKLGVEVTHDRSLCSMRATNNRMLCGACDQRELIMGQLYHEIGHIVFDSNEKPLPSTIRRNLSVVRRYHPEFTCAHSKLYEAPQGHIEMSMWHPVMRLMLGFLDDARVNAAMVRARPGTLAMINALTDDAITEGFANEEGSTVRWQDNPLDMQVLICMFLLASEFPIPVDMFDPKAVEIASDPRLETIVKGASYSVNVHDSFNAALDAFDLLVEMDLIEVESCKSSDDGTDDGTEDDRASLSMPGGSGSGNPSSSSDSSSEPDDDAPSALSHDFSKKEIENDPESPSNRDDSKEDSSETESSSSGDDRSMDDLPAQGGDDDETDGGQDDTGDSSSSSNEEDSGEEGEDATTSTAGETESELDEFDPKDFDQEDKKHIEFLKVDDDDSSDENDEGDDPDFDDEEWREPYKGKSTAEDLFKALKKFSFHRLFDNEEELDKLLGSIGPNGEMLRPDEHDHDSEDEDDPEFVKLLGNAISQSEHFDMPSVNIGELKEFSFPNHEIGWRPGPVQNFMPPESLVSHAVMKARLIFEANKKSRLETGRKSGKIDGRALAKRAPFNDPRMFKKRTIPGKLDYEVCIGLDVSGSTFGPRIIKIIKCAMAQAEVLNRVGVPFSIYAHTGGMASNSRGWSEVMDVWILPIKTVKEPWNDDARARLAGIGSLQANLDGHTLEYYRKVLDKSRAKVKILNYYSDGSMPCENYEEEKRILLQEIETCKKKRYHLTSVGIDSDAPEIYGFENVVVTSERDLMLVMNQLERQLTNG